MHAMNIFDIQMKNRFTGGCGEENNKSSGGITFNKNNSDKAFTVPCSKSIQNWIKLHLHQKKLLVKKM